MLPYKVAYYQQIMYIKKITTKKNLEVFDIETITKVDNCGVNSLVPYCISYTENDKIITQLSNYNTVTLVRIILDAFKPNKIYYAHNLKFDFSFIRSGLIELNIKYTWVYINDNLFKVIIHNNKKKIILKCSYKLIPIPLSKFYTLNKDLRKLYFPYSILNLPNSLEYLNSPAGDFEFIDKKYSNKKIWEYFILYNVNDCFILKRGLYLWFEELENMGIPNKQNIYTPGGYAIFFLKNILKSNISFKVDKNISNILKKSFFGGRSEVFGNCDVKLEKVLHFDFPNMYGSCMLSKLPNNNFKLHTGSNLLNLLFNGKEVIKPGFYNITIEYYSNIPVLPERLDKIYFRQGLVSGTYWYEELNFCLKYTDVRKFKINFFIESLDYDFHLRDFAEKFISIRSKNETCKVLGKTIINSLFGRLASSEDFSISLVDSVNKSCRGSYFNIPIASAITSIARVKLLYGIQDVIKNGGRVLYVDTDSIIAAFPKNSMVENIELGSIIFDTKKSDTSIKDSVFVAPKTYSIRYLNGIEVVKISGVNSNFINFDLLKESFFKNKKSIEVSSEIIFNVNFKITILNIKKNIHLQRYNKRLFNKDKTNTYPLTTPGV